MSQKDFIGIALLEGMQPALALQDRGSVEDLTAEETENLAQLLRFAARIAAYEREKCCKVKVGKPRELKPVGRGTLLGEQQYCFDKGFKEGAAALRAAIRKRGDT